MMVAMCCMRAIRLALAAAAVAGAFVACSFVHGVAQDDASTTPILDAPSDGGPIDAAVDAPPDSPPDASLTYDCPPPPTGCALFGCAGPASADSCYYYCAGAESFSTATSRCAAIGQSGCLVTLNDAIEDACVRANAGAGGLIYIGLEQSSQGSEPAGGWGWDCGSSNYGPNWTGTEPNNSGFGGEDCGAMNTAGGWVDVGCGETFRYVCELPRP